MSAIFLNPLLIASLLMLGSAGGLWVFIKRKLPQLADALEESHTEDPVGTLGAFRSRVQTQVPVHRVTADWILQMVLSRVRVWAMRTEHKTNEWLVAHRQRTQERKEKFSQEYWNKIKKPGDQ